MPPLRGWVAGSVRENNLIQNFLRPAPEKEAGFFIYMKNESPTVNRSASTAAVARAVPVSNSALGILFALSGCHLLNDTIQALLPAIYPLLKASFALSFTQIGLI